MQVFVFRRKGESDQTHAKRVYEAARAAWWAAQDAVKVARERAEWAQCFPQSHPVRSEYEGSLAAREIEVEEARVAQAQAWENLRDESVRAGFLKADLPVTTREGAARC